jgi:hypothetical protein
MDDDAQNGLLTLLLFPVMCLMSKCFFEGVKIGGYRFADMMADATVFAALVSVLTIAVLSVITQIICLTDERAPPDAPHKEDTRRSLSQRTRGSWVWRLLTVACVFAYGVGLHFKVLGQPPKNVRLNTEVSAHFLKSSKVNSAKRLANKKNLPLLVLLSQSDCAACDELKQSINSDSTFKERFHQFVVVYAEDQDVFTWQQQGHAYVPSVYFFAPGEEAPLPVRAFYLQQPHFYLGRTMLEWGMSRTLEAVKSGDRSEINCPCHIMWWCSLQRNPGVLLALVILAASETGVVRDFLDAVWNSSLPSEMVLSLRAKTK